MHATEPIGRGQGCCPAFVTRLTGGELPGRTDHGEEEPDRAEPELVDPRDLDADDVPYPDDAFWDVFIPDEDQRDPLPEPGDFWIEESEEPRVQSRELE